MIDGDEVDLEAPAGLVAVRARYGRMTHFADLEVGFVLCNSARLAAVSPATGGPLCAVCVRRARLVRAYRRELDLLQVVL